MKFVTGVLVTVLLLLQYPLWFSKNSWMNMTDVNQQLELLRMENQKLQARNAVLDAEVRDLKQGTDAIEERARNNLGMVRADEIFFQTVNENTDTPR